MCVCFSLIPLQRFLILSADVSASLSLPLCNVCALQLINEMSRGEGSWYNSNILSDLFLATGPGREDELSLLKGKRREGAIVLAFRGDVHRCSQEKWIKGHKWFKNFTENVKFYFFSRQIGREQSCSTLLREERREEERTGICTKYFVKWQQW